MFQIAALFLACILAGFALANLPAVSFITAGVTTFLSVIGVIAIIVFALFLIYLGLKVIIEKKWL
ncbi:hypothetical protein LS684_11015 [Cytobacillus spongiae]|jgi:hypothetical protein|uniref:hypothetical protein n=1 Tax=Cytobacillus spongiae TaxID=2901381 RepID=UPI001F429EE5|nr:hypothetical protein [Cytobacillus spongiae]UII54225.1 hypothetical protein LS684_11015 [Cytobacillus spongiae]